MKSPRGIERLDVGEVCLGPYPPAGFTLLPGADFGNGDFYGMHWPLGRENQEPIVCETMHDEWGIAPVFADVAGFADWLEANDGEPGDLPVPDDAFAPALFEQARAHFAAGRVEEAIEAARRACQSLPDVSEYQTLLARALQRAGRHEEAVRAALAAFHSPWSFGRPGEPVLRLLRSARVGFDDPVLRRAGDLTLVFGGTKLNPEYDRLRACIDEYLEAGQALEGLCLLQNFAYVMGGETVSFQQRYGFALEAWRTDFSRLCGEHLGDTRTALD